MVLLSHFFKIITLSFLCQNSHSNLLRCAVLPLFAVLEGSLAAYRPNPELGVSLRYNEAYYFPEANSSTPTYSE